VFLCVVLSFEVFDEKESGERTNKRRYFFFEINPSRKLKVFPSGRSSKVFLCVVLSFEVFDEKESEESNKQETFHQIENILSQCYHC